MVNKVIILLCLCCVVLCTFVGYLSKRAIEDSKIGHGPAVSVSCSEVLEERPTETSHLIVTGFIPGKHFASLDFDNDGQWEQLCVPFFPKKQQEIKHSYRAVLICFDKVPNREALRELVASGEIDTNYWPMRQNLDVAIHSQLAQQYRNMDFANSPVFHYGFETSNPVLGEASLKISFFIGYVAIFAAFVALLVGLVMKAWPAKKADLAELTPNTNRAGLPGGSVLDRVTSMRERQTV
jgi:hypothetical protein